MAALPVTASVALGDAPDGTTDRRPYAQVDVGDVRVTLYESLMVDGTVIIDIEPGDVPVNVTVNDGSVWSQPTGTTADKLIGLLAEAGIQAESPAHGALFVPVDEQRQLVTGYAGWHYAGLEVLSGDTWDPDENADLEDLCLESEAEDPEKVAAGIIREVQRLRTWTCPGCGRQVDQSDADIIVDHVRDCDRVDGAGQALPTPESQS